MIYWSADWHLTRYTWNQKRELDGDSYKALDSVVDLILSQPKEGKTLIIAGDIFNGCKADGMTLDAFTNAIDRLHEQNIKVLFIQGNHDRNVIPIPAVQGCVHIHKKLVNIDGYKIYGLDWLPREQLHEELKQIPECDILVMHSAFQHLFGFADAYDLTLEDIPGHVRNIVTGHIHVADITKFRGEGSCVSPGPTHPCNITESDTKGIYSTSPGSAPIFAFNPIPSRPILRLTLSGEAAVGSVSSQLNELKGNEYRPLVEIKYPLALREQVTALVAKHSDKVFFLEASRFGKLNLKEGERMTYERATLESSLPHLVNPETDTELYNFLHGMLTGNPREVIDRKLADEKA